MPNVSPLGRAELAEFEPLFQMIEAQMGFVPNSLFLMGRRPEILRAFAMVVGSVLGPGAVDPGLKQLVAHIASTASGCRYCQAHTASNAGRLGVSGEKIATAWEFERSPLFTDAERAALRLARDAAVVPNATTPAHFDDLRPHFDEDAIIEIVAVIALFGWLNRWNDTLATSLEDEPLGFAAAHLGRRGWSPGKHAC
ncbi:MAG: carboxymuconolactone decarboxylase family protein [Candidatus Binatia bacterium]